MISEFPCKDLPLIAIAVSFIVVDLIQSAKKPVVRNAIIGLIIIMFGIHGYKSYDIMCFHNAYQESMADLRKTDNDIKVASSQFMVQKIHAASPKYVTGLPQQAQGLLILYANGFRYLVIDPQAYISYTRDGRRFSPELTGYMEMAKRVIKPVKVYPHFSDELLKRFVLEHNVNLRESLNFIQKNKTEHYGELKVYDLRTIMVVLKELQQRKVQGI